MKDWNVLIIVNENKKEKWKDVKERASTHNVLFVQFFNSSYFFMNFFFYFVTVNFFPLFSSFSKLPPPPHILDLLLHSSISFQSLTMINVFLSAVLKEMWVLKLRFSLLMFVWFFDRFFFFWKISDKEY